MIGEVVLDKIVNVFLQGVVAYTSHYLGSQRKEKHCSTRLAKTNYNPDSNTNLQTKVQT